MKYLVIIFLFCILTGASFAQEKSLLWEISGKELKQPSYIYGTFHLLCANDFLLPDTLISVLHKTKQVYFELKLDDPSLTMKMMQNLIMKDGHDLKEYITKERYDSIAGIFQHKTQLSLAAVSKYKPFIISSFLYPAMLGCSPVSYETEIMNAAKKDSLQINGLETVDCQLKILDEIPYNIQAKMLEKSLLNFAKSVVELKELITIYKLKDIARIQKNIADEREYGKYEAILIRKRNANWLSIITTIITETPTFIAVGAGHLGGKTGIINLLRKNGFIVTPVLY